MFYHTFLFCVWLNARLEFWILDSHCAAQQFPLCPAPSPFHEYSNSGVCIAFLHYKLVRKGRMNYLAQLQEILVGLKPPKIGLVTPLLGKKH